MLCIPGGFLPPTLQHIRLQLHYLVFTTTQDNPRQHLRSIYSTLRHPEDDRNFTIKASQLAFIVVTKDN
ncbi:hypothetical protein J6590_043023 [Homalodisca vitripennis]|nr:hypothetical protein J6590_043023 [Homalodisca vitripennis]